MKWLWFCIAMLSCSVGFAQERSGIELLREFVEHRRSISRGVVEFRSAQNNLSTSVEEEWHWVIYFDGSKRRGDVTYRGGTRVSCYGCLDVDDTLVFFHNKLVDDRRVALAVYDTRSPVTHLGYIPPPQWIGAFTGDSGVLSRYNAETFFTPADGSARLSALEEVNGEMCQKVEWVDLEGLQRNAWFSSQHANRLVKCETRYSSGGDRYVESIVNDFAQYDSRVWYPSKVVFQQTINGDVSRSEVLYITRFEDEVPANSFSLAGIDGLTKGYPVVWAMGRDRPTLGGELVFDGENIIASDTSEYDDAIKVPWQGRSLLVIFAAATLLVCAYVYLRRSGRKFT